MRRRYAYMLTCHHQQEMLKIVFGQNCDGTIYRKSSIEQGLADTLGRLRHLRISEAPPFAVWLALRHAAAIGSDVCPVNHSIREDFGVRPKRFVGVNENRVVGERLHCDARCPQTHGTHARCLFRAAIPVSMRFMAAQIRGRDSRLSLMALIAHSRLHSNYNAGVPIFYSSASHQLTGPRRLRS